MNDNKVSIHVDKKLDFYLGIFMMFIVFSGLMIAFISDFSGFPILAFFISAVSAVLFLCSALLVREIEITEQEIFFKPVGISFDLNSIISIKEVAKHDGKAYVVIVKTNSERPIWIPGTFMHGNGTGKFNLRGGDGELFLETLNEVLSKRQNASEA